MYIRYSYLNADGIKCVERIIKKKNFEVPSKV